MNRVVPPDAIPVVAQCAREVSREFRGIAPSDLMAEGHLWVLENPRKTAEYLDHEEPRQGSRLLYASIRNHMRAQAQREIAAAYGYRAREMFVHYDVDQIRKELLPALFDRESWAEPPKPEADSVRSKQDPAHGNNWMTSLADLADAFRKLDRDSQAVLRLRYEDDLPQRGIAEVFDRNDEWVSNRIDTAVRKMHALLGGDRPEHAPSEEPIVGGRHAISRAQALAITGGQWDGE